MLLGLWGVATMWCAGCELADRVPTRPLQPPREALVNQQVSDGCTRFALKVVNGVPQVEALYNTNGCQTDQLQLQADSAPTFNATTGTLRVPIVMKNVGTVSVIAPARIRFNADSSQFLNGQGQVIAGSPDILATNYDTANASGRSGQWRYDTLLAASGQPQVLAPGATSGRRWLEFTGTSWSQTIRIKLPTAATQVGSVPAVAPDSVPSALLASLPTLVDTIGRSVKAEMLIVLFYPSATQPDRQAAISQVGGTVVGGRRTLQGDGWYFVHVPSATTPAQVLGLVNTLRSNPSVEVAGSWILGDPHDESWKKPDDGVNWRRSSWQVRSTAASGSNLALERISAPLAWGCTTGDVSVRLANVDIGYDLPTDVSPNVASLVEPTPSVATSMPHGTLMASVVAASGDNQRGIAGVMWSASLVLRNKLADVANPDSLMNAPWWVAMEDNLIEAGRSGASIVWVSQNKKWGVGIVPDTTVDAVRDEIKLRDAALVSAIGRLAAQGYSPLFVLSAGNEGIDARLTGFVNAKYAYPNQVMVVGALDTSGAVWSLSNLGPAIDVYAPGVDVGALTPAEKDTVATGTSFSAPLVAGTAGLVKAFDPSLTATALRSTLLHGSTDSVTIGGSKVPVLNAYDAIRQAARRPGAPLCGNRVWARGNSIVIQRGNTTESIQTTFTAADTIALVTVQHGGRLIEYHGQVIIGSPYGEIIGTLAYQNGAWTNVSATPLDPPTGGAWLSMHGVSHERDTVFYYGSWVSSGSPTDPFHRLQFSRVPTAGGAAENVEIQIPVGGYYLPPGSSEYWSTDMPMRAAVAFPMSGDTALLAVSMYHSDVTGFDALYWPKEARLYHVLLNTSPPTIELVSVVPDSAVFYVGLSEDGREKVLSVGRDSLVDTGNGEHLKFVRRCALQWSLPRFSATSGQELSDSTAARFVVTAPPPAQYPEGCSMYDDNGAGTIAPRIAGIGSRRFGAMIAPPTPGLRNLPARLSKKRGAR